MSIGQPERRIVDVVEPEVANFGVERSVSLNAPIARVHERARLMASSESVHFGGVAALRSRLVDVGQ